MNGTSWDGRMIRDRLDWSGHPDSDGTNAEYVLPVEIISAIAASCQLLRWSTSTSLEAERRTWSDQLSHPAVRHVWERPS
jgi:hypothetical protein